MKRKVFREAPAEADIMEALRRLGGEGPLSLIIRISGWARNAVTRALYRMAARCEVEKAPCLDDGREVRWRIATEATRQEAVLVALGRGATAAQTLLARCGWPDRMADDLARALEGLAADGRARVVSRLGGRDVWGLA